MGGGELFLLPETFKRLDHSKHTLVVTRQVHPCDWSLLSSTVSSAFSCVLSATCVQIHTLKCSRKAWECHSFTQLVPLPQDFCAFRLVPICTMEEDVGRHQMSAMHITIFGIPGWFQLKPHSPKCEWNSPWLWPESASAVMEK